MTDSAPAVEPPSRQRAVAEARATFAPAGGRTLAHDTFETGGLRWRFPRGESSCEAVLLNTGGGVAGGNSYRIGLRLASGAAVEATTVAAEKIYRSDGPASRIITDLSIAAGAKLAWLPQETILFDRARLQRRLDINLAGDAELLLVESLAFGRLAMGETRIDAALADSWRVRHDGRLIFADETRLSPAGVTLDRRAIGAGARAVAAILATAPHFEARLPDLRAAFEAAGEEVEAGASLVDGLLVARLVSRSPRRLRAALIAAIVALSGRPPPRLWQ